MAGHFWGTVENTVNGKPVSGATVEVYTSAAAISGSADEGFTVSGTYATIYSDDGVTSITQSTSPVTTDSSGFYEFWTNETSVVMLISYNGLGRRAISDVEIVGGSINSDVTALATRVDNHDTLMGTAANATDLGTFTGTTITDNVVIKVALQELETAVEAGSSSGDVTASGLTMSTARILGRTTASTGAIEEISVGTGLSLSAGSLSPALTQAVTVAQSGTPATTSVGYLGSPQISDQDDYTLTINDAGGHYYHVSATPHTLTIPANASVAFPIGTVIAIVNENGAGDITLAITSDTLRWTDQTGSRTIAANGAASLVKVTSTVWRLTGDGIT